MSLFFTCFGNFVFYKIESDQSNSAMILKKRTAGAILAAGMSRRFKETKQICRFKGKYLIEYAIDASLNSRLDRVFLILGHHRRIILRALNSRPKNRRLETVINKRYRNGMSSSLKAGMSKAAERGYDSIMFLLGDQPMINSREIDMMIDKFHASEKDICVPVCRNHDGANQRGNPVIFGKKFYPLLSEIKGDKGAREIIARHPEHIVSVSIDDPVFFADIDFKEDKALFS